MAEYYEVIKHILEDNMTCGIYKITEHSTGKCYIGQSKNIQNRWKGHHKRFSPQFFNYEILISCNKIELDTFEKEFIAHFDSHHNGFNKTIGGSGIKVTDPHPETIQKVSESMKAWHSERRSLRIPDALTKMRNDYEEERQQELIDFLEDEIKEFRKSVQGDDDVDYWDDETIMAMIGYDDD